MEELNDLLVQLVAKGIGLAKGGHIRWVADQESLLEGLDDDAEERSVVDDRVLAGCRRILDELSLMVIVEVRMVDHDCGGGVDVRVDLALRAVDGSEDLDGLLDQALDIVVLGDITLIAKWASELVCDIDEEDATSDGSRIVVVHDIREAVDIALAIPASFLVFGHHRLRVDREPDLFGVGLSDLAVALDRGLDLVSWRSEH
ncbi:hypothetical protein [Halococcus hamelinensis]|uniref:hypothetical protein n=1 Tax=Halococcus hamelinensis TaxID=332168 RepID=UPI001872B181|nr:hypothetical protein [Halococcus hamelinensis]